MRALIAAVDLGASSGRVMAATVDGNRIGLAEAARFPNRALNAAGRLYWDLTGLWNGILEGLRGLDGPAAVAVDSWAVDYALLDADGHLLGTPVCYRDPRTDRTRGRILDALGAEALYARTGIQHQPFNTVFQLASERAQTLAAADRALLIPDLIGYWLTGAYAWEATNASSTGLVDQATGTWAPEVCAAAGLPADLLGPITPTGTVIGGPTDTVTADTGLDGRTSIVATASHDTASAVAAVPYETENAAYISCGTWSLVGTELDRPVLSPAALEAGFTNERAADGRTRFLRNIAGLWLLQESLRAWARAGHEADLDELVRDAARALAPAPWSTPTTRSSPPPATCPNASAPGASAPASRSRRTRPRPPRASSTPWRWPTAAPSTGSKRSPEPRSRRSTSSAADPTTSCCAD
ncbi:hypothetical protein GCM10029992_45340 [Glycomyces albus]